MSSARMANDDGPQAKKARLAEPVLNDEEIRLLEEAEAVQEELDKINDELSEKVMEVERQFNRKRRPVWSKRSQVLRKIPGFWKTALMNHPIFQRLITDKDEEILNFLTDLDIEVAEDIKSGFKVILKFSDNPFIKNHELVKSYSYDDNGNIAVQATPVSWSAKLQEDAKFQDASFIAWISDSEDVSSATLAEHLKDEVWANPVELFKGEGITDLLDEDEDEDEDEGDTADEEDIAQ